MVIFHSFLYVYQRVNATKFRGHPTIIPGGWLQPRGPAPSRWFRRRRTLDGHDLVLKHIDPMVTWGFPMLRNPDIRNMMIIFIGITRGIPHFPADAHDSTMVPMKS